MITQSVSWRCFVPGNLTPQAFVRAVVEAGYAALAPQPWIAHYHTAGNPGRNDLDAAQEINYAAHEFILQGDPHRCAAANLRRMRCVFVRSGR